MQNTEQTAIFGIVEPMSTRYGNTLAAQFVAGSKLATYPFRPITCNTRDQPTEYAGQEVVQIQMVEPSFIFDDPILRSLLAETNSTFSTLQTLNKCGSKADYANVSRTYRSVIRACLQKLQEAAAAAENDNDDQQQAKYQQYVSLFYSIECIWHLCELLYLDQTTSHIVVPHLLAWIRFHFPTPERHATDLLLLGREANDNDEYWPTLKGLILQGQVGVTRALLQLHSQAETSAFKMADQILKAMPAFNAQSGFSIQKFRSQWQYWLTDTERKVAANILSSEPELEEIIQLVTGDIQLWNTYIKNSDYWYEYLPGYLFYTNPACKHFELGNSANTWLNRWARLRGNNDHEIQIKHLDRIILSLMENDIHQVIHSIQLMADNKWFVTHLSDLLYNCGQLQIIGENQINEVTKLREMLVYEFGATLMSRNSLWQLGMDYLDHCSAEGKAALELLLTKIPIKTDRQALKIINIARARGLTNVQQEICKVQSKKSFDDKRYGNALEWAIRSKDAIYVTYIADFLLNHYAKTGDMLCPDVLENLAGKMLAASRLTFLSRYFYFYQLYREREFVPAADELMGLLQSKITPSYFWPTLLIDTIPLLESEHLKIYSKETCVILNHLESKLVPLINQTKKRLETDPDAPVNILKDYRIENIEEIVNLLRLACARNLSRAIIIENTVNA